MIKNIIFDVGNVIVRWALVEKTFPHLSESQQRILLQDILTCEAWHNLNLGKITEAEARLYFNTVLALENALIDELFVNIKTTQELIPGTIDLIKTLHHQGYKLFALTDNIHEIVDYLKQRYDFWQYFLHVTVSAEVGLLKPNKAIYQHALQENDLLADETVFIDDLEKKHPRRCGGRDTRHSIYWY